MTLPVSSYEELLARVRSLTSETIQLRREITSSLCDQSALNIDGGNDSVMKTTQRISACEERNPFETSRSLCSFTSGEKLVRPELIADKKEDEFDNEFKEIDEKLTSPDVVTTKNSFQNHGKCWPSDNFGLWHSGPSTLCLAQSSNNNFPREDLTSSATCTSYEPQSLNNFSYSSKRTYSHQQLGAKVEMVYSLLSMLDTDNREDMSKTFLAMSSSPESCHAMRQSGCLPLLIQLIHSSELNAEVRNRAAEALYNIVHAQTDEKRRRREVRVLKLLEQLREYCEELKNIEEQKSISQGDSEKHPINAIGTLMKFSFDAEHRQAICTLGGLHTITDLIQVDNEAHRNASEDSLCITLRRYAGMSLTNLTFGDGKNKALLCGFNKFMRALVEQLKSPSEELRQVTASVLRNLSWRADEESKRVLRDVGAVTALTLSAMEGKKESTLKSILSALWNLSAHCSLNKVDICSVPGALAFLVKMLKYKSTSNTLAIVENAGGILRNISSHIAVREDYRQILRDNNCFEVLLEQLKSPSLTVVSNACGTLWNLSARCPEDQKRLWEMGATSMLRSLIQSKHKMISMGSSAALKNLLAANPNENFVAHLDSTAKSLGFQNLPTLFVRKKKALEQELNITLAETCENIDGLGSPSHASATQNQTFGKNATGPKRSDSRDSVKSTQSDSVYERVNQIVLKNREKLLGNNNATLHDSLNEKNIPRKIEEQKLIRRYKTSMIPLPMQKKVDQDRVNERTREEFSITEDEYHYTEDLNEKPKKGMPLLEMTISRNKSISGVDFSNNHEKLPGDEKESSIKKRSAEEIINSQMTDNLIYENDSGTFHSKKTNGDKGCESINIEECTLPTKSKVTSNMAEYVTETKNSCERMNDCKDKFIQSVKKVVNEKQNFDPSGSSSLHISNKSEEINEGFQTYRIRNNVKLRSEDTCSDLEIHDTAEERIHKEQKDSEHVLPLHYTLDIEIAEEQSPAVNLLNLEIVENNEQLTAKQSAPAEIKVFTSNYQESELDTKEIKCYQNKVVDCGKCEEVSESKFNAGSQSDKCNTWRMSRDILPNFKVGSPITDSKVLQYEASKICREIKKQQDLDLGCSLTSEVSLISCSSFLDPTEVSLFECSSDGFDFDESENQLSVKSMTKAKNLNFRNAKNGDSVSLPSLGSLKNEQIETLELDNSVLSLSSFTSEVADVEIQNFGCETYTKTYKNEDCLEQTIEDSSFPDEDETLNGDSLRINGEVLDDDSSLHCQENLPFESEVYENTLQDPLVKKLTPREKRKTFCDRYRTYTIKDVKIVEPSVTSQEEIHNGRKPVEKTPTPTNDDDDLYRKYSTEDHKVLKERNSEIVSISATFARNGRAKSFQFSKSFDKVQDSFPVEMSDSKSLNDLLSVGPDERKELVDNAKLVAFSLKTAVHDFDAEVVSDSEVEELQNSSVIDTATYSKNYRPISSPETLDRIHICDDHVTEDLNKKGPTVLKPDEKLETSKGIRGRRKPLYSSPQKSFKAIDPNAAKCSFKSPVDSKLSKPVLQREGTFTKEEVLTPKKTNRSGSALGRNFELKSSIPKLGVRNVSAPVSATSKTSRVGKPAVVDRRNDVDPVQKRVVSSGNANKTLGYGFSGKRHSTATPSSNNMRPFLNNQNNKANNDSLGSKSKNTSLHNLKSQSEANLESTASKDKGGKLKIPKKEATSKIASLWRKVEESKEKNKYVKDKRLWIGPEKNKNVIDGVLAIEQEEIVEIPSRKIMHSHTYQSLTSEVSDLKQKNFHGESSNAIRTGTEKRHVVSAVVQPYNYNPPTSNQVTSTDLKHVDFFHKASLKVTTV